ncbi:MAG TPA: alpha/beta fold hydrolase [Povalibacter sp.]|nr:alpha/beta fold hydrolase [Povalibacter sp.]
MSTSQLTLAMPNDTRLVLSLFEPQRPGSATVILPSAMGVAQKYYASFAQWLATQGYRVVTFDYRGVGLSAPSSLRGFRMDIFDWAHDCAAAIDLVGERWPATPLFWLGHSLGGQLLGLIPNRERIHRIMTVAAGNGYWLQNSWPTRRMVWWLWFVAVPLATRIAGYFPGRRLRKVGDLPRGVIEQWRRWCLNPEYVVGVEGDEVRGAYASITTPMMSVSFTDDEMMSERSIRSLHELYASAPVEYRRIAPRDIGVERIGHFGFFRPQFERTLWPLVPRWLAQ